MRVMIVSKDLGVGGAQTQTINLVKGLSRLENVEISFLLMRKGYSLSRELPTDIESEVIDFRIKLASKWPLRPILRAVAVWRAARNFKPDVIYDRFTTMPSVIAGKILGIPVVTAEINNQSRELQKIKPALFRIQTFLSRKLTRRLSTKIVANSSGLADEAQRFWKLKSRPHVIYNGLDIEVMEKKSGERAEHPWLNDKKIPLIVSVARLVSQKGFPYLIEALSIVNQTVRARLVIVGGRKGTQEVVKRTLLTQIDRLKLGDCVSLIDEKPNPYPFMKAASLYVCSSLYEGFSNALLEAMFLGLPIVSTDHDFGANEMIEDGKSGLLVPVADPEAMAGVIIRVLKDGQLRERLSQNARARALDFTLEKTVQEYEKLFLEVASKKKRAII